MLFLLSKRKKQQQQQQKNREIRVSWINFRKLVKILENYRNAKKFIIVSPKNKLHPKMKKWHISLEILFVCMYVCMCVCVCIYIYIYIHTHIFFNELMVTDCQCHLRTGSSCLLSILYCHCYWHCYNLYSSDYQSVEADMSRRTVLRKELLSAMR